MRGFNVNQVRNKFFFFCIKESKIRLWFWIFIFENFIFHGFPHLWPNKVRCESKVVFDFAENLIRSVDLKSELNSKFNMKIKLEVFCSSRSIASGILKTLQNVMIHLMKSYLSKFFKTTIQMFYWSLKLKLEAIIQFSVNAKNYLMRRVDITCSPNSDLCFSRPERSLEKLAENEESRSVLKNLEF